MKVEVRLFAYLDKYLPSNARGKRATLELSNSTRADTIIKQLGIPEELASIVLVNGIHSSSETELKEGDVVSFFPPIAGG